MVAIAEESPAEVVWRFQEAIGRGGWDDAAATLDADVFFYEAPTLPFGGDHHGVDGYCRLAEAFAELADFEFSPDLSVLTTTDGVVIVRGGIHRDREGHPPGRQHPVRRVLHPDRRAARRRRRLLLGRGRHHRRPGRLSRGSPCATPSRPSLSGSLPAC